MRLTLVSVYARGRLVSFFVQGEPGVCPASVLAQVLAELGVHDGATWSLG